MVQAAIPRGTSVLDLPHSVGYSTAPGAVGIDTSSCFLDAARLLARPQRHLRPRQRRDCSKTLSHDVVTLMFATHEMPREARQRVLANACRIAPAGRRRRHRPGVQARADDRPAARRAGEGLPVGRAVRARLPRGDRHRRRPLRARARLAELDAGGPPGPRPHVDAEPRVARLRRRAPGAAERPRLGHLSARPREPPRLPPRPNVYHSRAVTVSVYPSSVPSRV